MNQLGGGQRPKVVAVLVLLLCFLVIAVETDVDGSSRQDGSGQLSKYFQLLRETPSGLPSSIGQLLPSSFGGDWDSARALPLKHHRVWLVPAEADLCLVISDPGESPGVVCAAHRYVIRHGLFLTSLLDPSAGSRGPRRTIVGVVPDYAEVARLITPGFPTVRPKLVDGAFEHHDEVSASPQYAALRHG